MPHTVEQWSNRMLWSGRRSPARDQWQRSERGRKTLSKSIDYVTQYYSLFYTSTLLLLPSSPLSIRVMSMIRYSSVEATTIDIPRIRRSSHILIDTIYSISLSILYMFRTSCTEMTSEFARWNEYLMVFGLFLFAFDDDRLGLIIEIIITQSN